MFVLKVSSNGLWEKNYLAFEHYYVLQFTFVRASMHTLSRTVTIVYYLTLDYLVITKFYIIILSH